MKQTERRAGGLATNGDTMKKLGVSLAIMIASGAAAHAADLPTTKAPPPPGELLCEFLELAQFNRRRLPAELGPLHRLRDARRGAHLRLNGAPYSAAWNNGVNSFIQKQSYGAKWLWSPNNLSQSVAGIKVSQPVALWLVDCRHLGMGI